MTLEGVLDMEENLEVAAELPVAEKRVPVGLFALSVGVIFANVTAPQTLVGLIGSSYGLAPSASGLIATTGLLGYAIGLFFIVPLADLVENRRLALRMLAVAIACAVGIPFAPNAATFFVLLFTLSAACSMVQVLVPAAAAMTAPQHRGRVIGDIMSGLLVGILLSRPVASFLAGTWGWHSFYFVSAAAMTLLAITLAARLEKRDPVPGNSYAALIGSMGRLFVNEPVLFRRSISAAIVMAAFNFFWTTIVFVLQAEPFQFGQKSIAVFALAGAGGAIISPFAGRWADRGLGGKVTAMGHLAIMIGFGFAALSGLAHSVPILFTVTGLALSAVVLDMGVVGDQTVGRYLINLINPEARGWLNAIFVGVFFIGGAAGSALSGILWARGGWAAVCVGGAALGLLALVLHIFHNFQRIVRNQEAV